MTQKPVFPIETDATNQGLSRLVTVRPGIRAGRGVIDVEYTQINPNTDYITVGYMLPF